jgi:hypothetical protein
MYLGFRCKETRATKAPFDIAACCGTHSQLVAQCTTCGSVLPVRPPGHFLSESLLEYCYNNCYMLEYCYNNCYMCKNPIVSTEELRA